MKLARLYARTSLNLTSQAGSALTISPIETGFKTARAEEFLSDITGIFIDSSAVMSTYLGEKDKRFGESTPLAAGLLDNQSASVLLPALPEPYSLTEVVTITAGAHRLTSIDAAILDVPAPASLPLLGACLA